MALRHNHVDAGIDHLLGVLDLADHRHDPGAIGMKAVHPRSGIAEAGGIDWHLFLDYHFHLRLEKLPREQLRTALAHFRRASRAHGHCGIHFGQILAFHEIAGELLIFAKQCHRVFERGAALRCRTAPDGGRQKGVDPKWLIGQFAGLADPAAQLVWRAGRSAKNAKSPGIRYCGRERGDTRPAHSGQKDRVFDPENFAYAALECHRNTLSIQRHPPAPVFYVCPHLTFWDTSSGLLCAR